MNILVTGANGQLGNSIRKISASYPNNYFFTDMPEVDITNLALLENLMKEKQIDAIINCAAYTAVDKAEDDVALATKINVDGPRNLAIAAKNANAKLVHVSTDYVFGGKAYLPLKESDPTAPIGVYGRTKLAGEEAVKEVGCDAVVVRTAWLYSEFGGNFVKTMLRLGRERSELGVVYDQVGTPTYATDLAVALMELLTKGFSGFSLYHYSNEGVISWYDFAKTIFDLSDIHIKLNALESSEYPSKAERPAYSVLNKKKIREAGIKVPYWRDSLVECLRLLNA
ncbi:MAG: dTDP-4-dehydrorhamnose reductase [Paludibacteraceae bacterium]|nr:dTDP-4-dehydrorhamnose reductase [Paludibacteraceae bacterium]